MKNSGKKQHGFAVFEVLFFVLLAVVITGAAYYIGTRHNKSDKASSSTTSSSGKPASIVSDSTADWLTHTGSEYTIKYPKDWKFYAKGEKFPIVSDTSQPAYTDATNDYLQNSADGLGATSLTISVDKESVDSSTYMEEVFPSGEAPQGQITNKQNFTISDYTATTYSLTFRGVVSYKTAVSNKKKVLYFDYLADHADTVNQIIKTAKIL